MMLNFKRSTIANLTIMGRTYRALGYTFGTMRERGICNLA